MSAGVERCTCTAVLKARTNGMGGAFLECDSCHRVEAIVQQADPYPSLHQVRAKGNPINITVPHGTNAGYIHRGCRCDACRVAHRNYNRENERKQKVGT